VDEGGATAGTYTPVLSGASGVVSALDPVELWSYLQVGKYLTISGVVALTLTGGKGGVGEFVFTLPNGMLYDTSKPYQVTSPPIFDSAGTTVAATVFSGEGLSTPRVEVTLTTVFSGEDTIGTFAATIWVL